MDKIRLTGFVLRQACERLERELNQVLAQDMTDPMQQRATIERVIETRHQLDIWLEIAAGDRSMPDRSAAPDGALTILPTVNPRPPLAGELTY